MDQFGPEFKSANRKRTCFRRSERNRSMWCRASSLSFPLSSDSQAGSLRHEPFDRRSEVERFLGEFQAVSGGLPCDQGLRQREGGRTWS